MFGPAHADAVIYAVEDQKIPWDYKRMVISSTAHPPISYAIDLSTTQDKNRPDIKQNFGKFGEGHENGSADQITLGQITPHPQFFNRATLATHLVPAIREHLAPQHAQEKIAAFEKIYKALREGQSSWIKTNYLSKITEEDRKDPYALYNKIKKYAEQNPKGRAGKAWQLLHEYFDNDNATLKKHLDDESNLEEDIYKWSFAQSGLFKMSKSAGQTFFSSTSLRSHLEGKDLPGQNGVLNPNPADNSRLAKIRKALGS